MKRLAAAGGVLIIVALATGSLAVNSAATVNGHFVHDAPGGHALLIGEENSNHQTEFSVDGGTPIKCTKVGWTGTVTSSTVTTIQLEPSYIECTTQGSGAHNVKMHMKGCKFTYSSNSAASTHSPTAQGTFAVDCGPTQPYWEITHPNCVIRVPQQSLAGATYTRIFGSFGKHEVTLTVHATEITTHYESGICIFLGTTHTASMFGPFIVRATDTVGAPVNFTAT